MSELLDSPRFRLEDTATFVAVFRRAVDHHCFTITELLNKEILGSPLTTLLGQLERITNWLYAGDPAYAARGRKAPIDFLFVKDNKGSWLKPTRDAEVLYREFCLLHDLYAKIRDEVRDPSHRTVLRIGAPPAIHVHVLSAVLSSRPALLEECDIRVTVDHSRELVRQLAANLLEMVVAWGAPEGEESEDQLPGVGCHHLNLNAKLLLVCHPQAVLRTHQDTDDLNAGYFEWLRSGGRKRSSGSLRSVRFDEVDLSGQWLHLAPSWQQPACLRALETGRKRVKGITYCPSYDECLAMVRVKAGVAIVPEIYARRARMCPFVLQPEASLSRPLTLYVKRPVNLDFEARVLAYFIDRYFAHAPFARKINTQLFPAIDQSDYRAWVKRFQPPPTDWNPAASSSP